MTTALDRIAFGGGPGIGPETAAYFSGFADSFARAVKGEEAKPQIAFTSAAGISSLALLSPFLANQIVRTVNAETTGARHGESVGQAVRAAGHKLGLIG